MLIGFGLSCKTNLLINSKHFLSGKVFCLIFYAFFHFLSEFSQFRFSGKCAREFQVGFLIASGQDSMASFLNAKSKVNVPCRTHISVLYHSVCCLAVSHLIHPFLRFLPFLHFFCTHFAVLVVMQKAHQAFVCISWQNEHFMASQPAGGWLPKGWKRSRRTLGGGNGFSTNMHVGTFLHRIALKCRKWHIEGVSGECGRKG